MNKNHITLLKNVYDYAEGYMSEYADVPYHNFSHAKRFSRAAIRVAKEAGYNTNSESHQWVRFILATAGLLHDLTSGPGHERRNAELADEILTVIGYGRSDIEFVKKLIIATDYARGPATTLEMIMRDADTLHLGDSNYDKRSDELRAEMGIAYDPEWAFVQLDFFDNHRFFTQAAERISGRAKEKWSIELEYQVNYDVFVRLFGRFSLNH